MNNANNGTERETEISKLVEAIAMAEGAAQNAEDRDNMKRAYQIRAQARVMQAQLDALVAS